jgi:hypothetical protein
MQKNKQPKQITVSKVSDRVDLILPQNACLLTGSGFVGRFIHPRRSRGSGNVGISFIDFQDLWEEKTA